MRYFTFLSVLLMLGVLKTSGQSQRQIKDRKIHSSLIKTVDSRKAKTDIKWVYSEYDKKGNVVLLREFDTDSVCTEYSTFVYDRKGRLIEEVSMNPKTDLPVEKLIKVYDKWGKLIKTEEVDADGRLVVKTVVSYNALGDKVSEEEFNEQGVAIRKSVYEYNKVGLILNKKIYDESGKLIYQRSYDYE